MRNWRGSVKSYRSFLHDEVARASQQLAASSAGESSAAPSEDEGADPKRGGRRARGGAALESVPSGKQLMPTTKSASFAEFYSAAVPGRPSGLARCFQCCVPKSEVLLEMHQ